MNNLFSSIKKLYQRFFSAEVASITENRDFKISTPTDQNNKRTAKVPFFLGKDVCKHEWKLYDYPEKIVGTCQRCRESRPFTPSDVEKLGNDRPDNY